MIPVNHQDQVILTSDIIDDTNLSASLAISPEENQAIDNALGTMSEESHECHEPSTCVCNTCSAIEADPWRLHERLSARADLGKFQMSIGSTVSSTSSFLTDAPKETDNDSVDDPPVIPPEENPIFKDKGLVVRFKNHPRLGIYTVMDCF